MSSDYKDTLNHQDIINETLDPKNDELTILWTCEQIINPNEFQFTHRNIEVNDYGNPVLRLYPEEIKLLYKDLYNQQTKVPWSKDGDFENIINIYDGTVLIATFDNETKRITAVNEGTGVLKSSEVNNYFDTSQFNDKDIEDEDLIVVVEKTPEITDIEWNNSSNIIYVEPNSETKIDFKLTYSNNDTQIYSDNTYLNLLHLTNKCYGEIENGYYKAGPDKGLTYVIFNRSDELENVKLPEKLKIIICHNKELPETVESIFTSVELYPIDIDSTDTPVEFYEELTETDPIVKYDRINAVNLRVSNEVVCTIENNKIIPHSLGFTNIILTSDMIDLLFYLKDEEVVYPVWITKSIEKITWELARTTFNVGDNVQITVWVNYTDDSKTDISHWCTFEYDERFLTISGSEDDSEEDNNESNEDSDDSQDNNESDSSETETDEDTNKDENQDDNEDDNNQNKDNEEINLRIITALAPGTTTIKLNSDIFIEDTVIEPEEIEVTIIQPVTRMSFNKHELELIIGEKEKLEFIYQPQNATPVDLQWYSTNPTIASVDSDGTITALSEGSVEVIIRKKIENSYEVSDDGAIINEEDNIYLPEDLDITVTTDKQGVANINLLESILYQVTLKNKGYAIQNAKVRFTSNNEQQIFITMPYNEQVTYDDEVNINVINFYEEPVKGMNITTRITDKDGNIQDLSVIKTDVDGNAIISRLNKTLTDEKGVAQLDGLRIEVQYIHEYLKDVEINHVESKKIIITLPKVYELEMMKNIFINITEDEDNKELRNPINNIQTNVIMNDILIFSGYPDENGQIKINSNEEVDDIFESNNDDEEEIESETLNFLIYDPTKCAVCYVTCVKIPVTKIYFDVNPIILNKDKYETFTPKVIIEPENATYKEISYLIEDDNIAKFDSNDNIYGFNLGETKLIAISKDNKEITAETIINVVSYQVEKVMITTSENDEDYEYFDHLNLVTDPIGKIQYGSRVTNEKYDDDDFKRYYLPINNSMQLSATVYPSNASDDSITWLSSNSNLVKITNTGIITALSEFANKDLDVYGDDIISETRFANTVWITALNKKYKKYDICQVRVTQNNIIEIDVPYSNEHDYDIDDIDMDGNYDRYAEHEYDYVINVGETIEIPVKLNVQDDKFGPSNSLKWFTTANDVLEIEGGTPNHSNAFDNEFDWNYNTPEIINKNKKDLILKVTGKNIGDADLWSSTYVINNSNRGVGDPQLYIPKNAITINSDDFGNLVYDIGPNNSEIIIQARYYSKSSNIMKQIKDELRNRIYEKLDIITSEINKNANEIKENLKNKLNSVFESTSINTTGDVYVTINDYKFLIIKNGKNNIEEAINEFIDSTSMTLFGTNITLEEGAEIKLQVDSDDTNNIIVENIIISNKNNISIEILGKKYEVISDGKYKVEEVLNNLIDENRLATYGVPITDISGTFLPDGRLYIKIPQEIYVVDYSTSVKSNYRHSFKCPIVIDERSSINANENLEEYINSHDSYIKLNIMINVQDLNNNIEQNYPIYLQSYYNNNNNVTNGNWSDLLTLNINEDNLPNISGEGNAFIGSSFYFPSTQKVEISSLYANNMYNNNPWDAKPGTGLWIEGPRSRTLRIRVVATPTNIRLAWCNVYSPTYWNANNVDVICYRNKWSKNTYKYMIVGYDNEFNELLKHAINNNETLAEKYESFAWFSDNEEVIRFEDVEELSYMTKNGEYTNDPNESYQITKSDPYIYSLKRLNNRSYNEVYEGYYTCAPYAKLKIDSTYNNESNNGLQTNSSGLSVIKVYGIINGTITINFTGQIAINTKESIDNASVFDSNDDDLEKKDDNIGIIYTSVSYQIKRDNPLYIMGSSDTLANILSVSYEMDKYVGDIYNYTIVFNKQMYDNISDKSNVYYVDINETPKTSWTNLNEIVQINISGGCSDTYISSDGLKIDNSKKSQLRLIPNTKGEVNIKYKDGAITIISDSGSHTYSANESINDILLEVEAKKEYYISHINDNYTTITEVSYVKTLEEYEGSYKGTNKFKVKPSYIKRVICEGRGRANIYVVSPKGQTVASAQINIE